jgi:hypothetical protein
VGSTFFAYADLAIGPNGEVLATYQSGRLPGVGACPVVVHSKFRPAANPSAALVVFAPGPGTTVGTVVAEVSLCEDRQVGNEIGGEEITPNTNVFGRGAYANPAVAWDHAAGRAYIAYLDGQEQNPESPEVETRIFIKFATPPFDNWLPLHTRREDPDDPMSPLIHIPVRDWNEGTPGSPFFFEFHQEMKLDQGPGPTQGAIVLCWYDTSLDPTGLTSEFWTSASTNQGETFGAPVRLTTAPTSTQGIDLQKVYGDYVGLTIHRSVFFPVWSANKPGVNPTELYTQAWEVVPGPP